MKAKHYALFLLFVMLLLAMAGGAQTPVKIATPYEYKALIVTGDMTIPGGVKIRGFNGSLQYSTNGGSVWTNAGSGSGGTDTTGSSGGGTTYSFSPPLSLNGSIVSLPGWRGPAWDSAYNWWKSNPLSPYYTGSTVDQIFSGALSKTGYNRTNWDHAYTFVTTKNLLDKPTADGLYAPLGTTSVTTLAGLSDVNTSGQLNGYVVKWNSSTLKYELKPDRRIVDFIFTRSGEYNTIYGVYEDGTLTPGRSFYDQASANLRDTSETFTGTATQEFTLAYKPASVKQLTINNVPVSPGNYTVVDFLLSILNYAVEASDTIVISYAYMKQ